jgi:hypothetical protein
MGGELKLGERQGLSWAQLDPLSTKKSETLAHAAVRIGKMRGGRGGTNKGPDMVSGDGFG